MGRGPVAVPEDIADEAPKGGGQAQAEACSFWKLGGRRC